MPLVGGNYGDGISAKALRHMPRVIGTLGGAHFGQELISLLADVCDADHCTVFRITEQSPCEIVAVSRDGTDTAHRQCSLYVAGSFWRHDVPMVRAMRSIGSCQTSIDRSEIEAIPDREYRDRIYSNAHIRDRILLCGGTAEQFVGLSILRMESAGSASDQHLMELEALSDTLISLLSKHISMVNTSNGFSLALTSLPEIEVTLAASDAQLRRREAEVCARILYGISSAGIALDLNIGEETVATYRKRAYQRLGIATQRELLVWYIREWGRLKTEGHPAAFWNDSAARGQRLS